jgi:hypothetical protein
MLCGVHRDEVPLTDGRWQSDIAGTAAAYVVLHSPGTGRSRITIQADAAADLQVTLLPLPADLPRLSMTAEKLRAGEYRLVVTAHDGDVTLEDAAWEVASSSGHAADTNFRADAVPGETVRAWFDAVKVEAGSTKVSRTIELPPTGNPVFFKLCGRDAAGRKVTALMSVTSE